MVFFKCPVCGASLVQEGKSLYCQSRHCYDISKKGYVNLLPPSGSGTHGDNKLMVEARTSFLNGGFYDPLSNAVCKAVVACIPDNAVILDAGCGEGKYTYDILNAVSSAGRNADIIGTDISKEALICAARRTKAIRYAAASSAALPLPDGCADAVLNIFSPLIPGEFRRVLKNGGVLIRVIPLERHLWELKEYVYEHPYENDIPSPEIPGFTLYNTADVVYPFKLNSSNEIQSLFKMTPYYYKTGAADQRKLENLNSLTVTAAFRILQLTAE